MSSKRDKWVRRFSVDETAKHKNGFTIYKITSVLFPLDSPEAVTVVSVWKRYSDVQKLHKNMKTLHTCLHLGGVFPNLVSGGYFKRFQQETIGERAKSIKVLLEFIAEHRLLFASMEFVAFLQSGYPAPRTATTDSHTTNVHTHNNHTHSLTNHTHSHTNHTLPLNNSNSQTRKETVSPLRDDEDSDSISRSAMSPLPPPLIPPPEGNQSQSRDETDYSQIPIHEPFDVELRKTPENPPSKSDSFESIASIESLSSDMFEDINKIKIDPSDSKPLVKNKNKLPDLITFDAPSTSTRFDDYHTMKTDSETVSLNSTMFDSTISEVDSRSSKLSSYKTDRSMPSLSNIESKTVTEDSYVFEAGYLLNLAARSEDAMDYQKAFDYYKAGIEKMLVGVQSDSDSRRRALIKRKTNKYLSYAENIYKNHLCNNQETVRGVVGGAGRCGGPPARMVRAEYSSLAQYRVLRLLAGTHLLLHRDGHCYAMKVIHKIPHNLTEFDEYFLKHTQETRQPILPTLVPYMVQLHSYVETNNLFFLILTYVPGEKLVDYIKNYEKTAPNTPQRRVNLENVFTEPKSKTTDSHNNIDSVVNKTVNNNIDSELSVNEMVINSQRLLLNVDKALNDEPKTDCDSADLKKEQNKVSEEKSSIERIVTPEYCRKLPPSAICGWGAEILTALDGLHNCGVICRDLKPANILLSSNGHITLTYFPWFPDSALLTHTLTRSLRTHTHMYVAPELFQLRWNETEDEEETRLERVCDYWSFGAIMYELITGKPLYYYHRSVFTSHTILHIPDNVPIEAQSLLTQLLTFDHRTRLGSGPEGINEIRTHPYFKQVDWDAIYNYWENQLLNANQVSAV